MHTVLVVEDEDEIRALLTEMLSERGYVVEAAANGQEALEKLGTISRPCVVLLDLMMPVMDGFTMRAKMLADPRLADIPVVIVSGAADVHASIDSLRAARVLTKPVKFPSILESVRAHC